MTWTQTLIEKDPNSIEPQGLDWTDYLAELGASVGIDSSTWTVSTITDDAAPLTLSDDSIVTGDRKTSVFLTGGTEGSRYTVTNRIITDSVPPVTDDRSFLVLIKSK